MGWSRVFGDVHGARYVVRLGLCALLASAVAACDSPVQDLQALDFDGAPEPKVIALVKFSEPVADTVAAGPFAFLLHETSGFSVTELGSNVADEPKTHGPFPTLARIVAVEYDEAARVAYVVDASGAVMIVDLAVSTSIRVVATVNVSSLDVTGTDAASRVGAVQIARSAQRLFVMHGTFVQPIFINRAGGAWSLAPEKIVQLPRAADLLAASGGNLFLGFTNGGKARVEAWAVSLLGTLEKQSTIEIGGELRALLARGAKLLVLSRSVGLRVVDYYRPSSPRVVYDNDQFGDVSGARLFGRTLLVGLGDRKLVSTLDVSDFLAPFVLTTSKGVLPAWMALIDGNVFMGDSTEGTVFGIPPVLAAGVPQRIRDAFPLSGQIPITFSKQVDPASLVKRGAIALVCNGQPVTGTPWLSPDGFTLNFRPLVELLVSQKCTLDVSGVLGWNQLALASGRNGRSFTFTTVAKASAPTSPGSDYPHTADGKFTGCNLPEPADDSDAGVPMQDDRANAAGEVDAGTGECEWFDVQPAHGRYTYFYADFDGDNLWLLNDWFYNGEDIDPDCYNSFQVWTGGGSERWEIRAYGDQRVEVTKNGQTLDATTLGVEGGKFYGPSPNVSEPHTLYELKIPAAAGSWGVQLHDPGPTFLCNHLEADTVPLSGSVQSGQPGGSISVGKSVELPSAPTLLSPADEATEQPIDVQLGWTDDNGVESYVYYRVEVGADAAFDTKLIDTSTWARSFTPRRGVLAADTTYHWRVSAQNQAGSATSEVFSFTTTKRPSYVLSTAISGQGSVTSSDAARAIQCDGFGGSCQASLSLGDTITLTATEAQGWTFVGWSGSCSGTDKSVDVSISGDTYCVASFTAPNGSGTVWTSRAGNGSGRIQSIPMGIDCGADCNQTFAVGAEITLTATPSEGSTFVAWSGDCSGVSPSIQVKLSADQYCTAVFSVPESGKNTLSVSPTGGGAITSSDGGIDCPSTACSAAYDPGATVTLTAKAASGYTFERWTGDCASGGSSVAVTLTLSGYRSCGATFVSNTPPLTVFVNGSGTVKSTPGGIDCASSGGNGCSASFTRGAVVTLTATPESQAVFAGWSGDCSGAGTTTTVTVDRARSCTATFAQSSLYVYVSGSGTVTSNPGSISCASNGGSGCSEVFAAGTSVTLTASPGQGYAFSGWSGDCSGTGTTATVSVTGTKSCTAQFTTRTLTAHVSGVGTVTSSPSGIDCTSNGGTGCSQNYASNTTVQLTAAPGNDYVFLGWSGCSQSTSTSIDVNVNGNVHCYATFASNSNTLTLYGSGDGNGSVSSNPSGVSCTSTASVESGACSSVFAYDQQVTLTATPASSTDYFAGWSGNCQGSSLTTTVTMNGSKACYATFQKNRLQLVVSSGQGTITGNAGSLSCTEGGGVCSANVAVGTMVQLTASPGPSHSFTGWSGCSQSTSAEITVTVSTAQTCYANFATYTLTTYVSPTDGGVVTSADGFIDCTNYGGVGCQKQYATYGQQVQLTAAPAANHVFIGWSGCSQSNSPQITVTLNGSQSCYATFEPTTLTVYVSGGAGTVTGNAGGISCTTSGGNGCSATFTPSTVVQLTAAPGQNHVFTGWSGDCSGTNPMIDVTVSRAIDCYASFLPNVLTIADGGGAGTGTVTTSPGSISCTDGAGACSEFFDYNQQVQLTAAPSVGSVFSYWSGNCSGSNPVISVSMVGSRTCYPVFGLQQFTGSVSVTGNGGVTTDVAGVSCGSDCSQQWAYGTQVTVTAVPMPGETFLGWGGACITAGSNPTFTFAVPAANVSCSAQFSTTTTPGFAGVFAPTTYDSVQCTDWNAFRTALSANTTYARVTVRSSLDATGVTCTGAAANTLCQALRTGSAVSGASCGGALWDVGSCGGSTELHVGSSSNACGCGGTGHFTVRPCYGAPGYNGYGDSCDNPTSQTLSVDCAPPTVSVLVSGAGTVASSPSGIACPGDCSEDFANATEVTLTATPSQGETFLGWSGDCDAAGTNTQAIVMASAANPASCTAQFSASKPKVLLVAAETSEYVMALQNALTATATFTVVDAVANPNAPTTPSLATLQQYDVVLVWTDANFSNPTALGNNLADYYDGGGRVVVAMFALGGHSFAGRFANAANGYMLIDPAGAYGVCSGIALGTVAEPGSALMSGVSTIATGNYCAKGAVVNGGTVVASWTGGDPMVIRGNVQGRNRVDLNLWLSSLGGDTVTLVKNALLYQ